MKQKVVSLVLISFFSLSVFGCTKENEPHEIKAIASSEVSAIDKKNEELEVIPPKEPSDELVKKRREALIKAFETGEGCPSCASSHACDFCTIEKACTPSGECERCKKGEPCPLGEG